MRVTFRHYGACLLCRCRVPGWRWSNVRVGRRSLQETRPGLMFVDFCPECDTWADTGLWALDADSRARVDAVRAGRGRVA